MREPYGKAVAPQTGPEPWRCVRKDVLQALAGVRAGWVLSREIILSGASRQFPVAEDPTCASLKLDAHGPRAVVDPMHVRRLSGQELGDPMPGRGSDGAASAAAMAIDLLTVDTIPVADTSSRAPFATAPTVVQSDAEQRYAVLGASDFPEPSYGESGLEIDLLADLDPLVV